MHRLTSQTVAGGGEADGIAGGGVAGAAGEGLEGELAGAAAGVGGLGLEADDSIRLPGPGDYEKTLDAARNMIAEDPKRVAQVVKKWIAEDGG